MRIILDIPIMLSDVICAVSGRVNDAPIKKIVYAISTDSRECEDGDLYFSLASTHEKRIEYAADAMARGGIPICDADGFIRVESTEKALLSLAAFYKSRLPYLSHTVGITGSVGKSTTKRYTTKILSQFYKVSSTIGNFNNRIGISLSILSARRDTQILVLEMGMNHKGEIREMAEVIRPDFCVITNIGSAHIGNLGGREAIRDAKCEIITDSTSVVFFPANEPLLENIPHGVSLSPFGDNADIILKNEGEDFYVVTPKKRIEVIRPPINGYHNLSNLLYALAVGIFIGLNDSELKSASKSLSDDFLNARLHNLKRFTLIDDTYNSSPEAAKAMIDYLLAYPSPRFAVLSDMLELGATSGELHYALGQKAARLDGIYLIGQYADDTARGAIDSGMHKDGIRIIQNTDSDAIADILYSEIKEGTVLIKGSHATRLCDVVKKLCIIGDQTTDER